MQAHGEKSTLEWLTALHLPTQEGPLIPTFESVQRELTLSDNAQNFRDRTIRHIQSELEDFLRSSKVAAAISAPIAVHVFGSVSSGLDIPSSDIDFALLAELPSNDIKRLLRDLARALPRRGLPARLIPARVPVVQVTAACGTECDVTVQDALCLYKAALLRAYGRADPRFRSLFRALKHWARRRGLNDAFRGTLNSFAYALLTVQFLQTRSPPVLPCLHAPRVVDRAGRAHDLPPVDSLLNPKSVDFPSEP